MYLYRGVDNFLGAWGAKCQNHLFCVLIKGKMCHRSPNFGNVVVVIVDLRLVAASCCCTLAYQHLCNENCMSWSLLPCTSSEWSQPNWQTPRWFKLAKPNEQRTQFKFFIFYFLGQLLHFELKVFWVGISYKTMRIRFINRYKTMRIRVTNKLGIPTYVFYLKRC